MSHSKPPKRRSLIALLAAVFALALASTTTVAQASQPDSASNGSHVAHSDDPEPTSDAPPGIDTPPTPPTSSATPLEDEPEEPPSVTPMHRRPLLGRIAPQTELPHHPGDPDFLALPGLTGAWFYRPQGGEHRARVLLYLHARNADPRESCRTFHTIASRFGWLVCPIGPVDRGSGRREWRNDRDYANRESIVAIEALAGRFPGRVRRHDNVVMGFSEGAYVGMSVGLMNPQTFPRWLIFAADDRYIESEGERIHRAAGAVRRVFLLTGETDAVVDHTHRAFEMLEHAWGPRHIHMRVLEGAGHELPPNFVTTVRRVLLWLTAH